MCGSFWASAWLSAQEAQPKNPRRRMGLAQCRCRSSTSSRARARRESLSCYTRTFRALCASYQNQKPYTFTLQSTQKNKEINRKIFVKRNSVKPHRFLLRFFYRIMQITKSLQDWEKIHLSIENSQIIPPFNSKLVLDSTQTCKKRNIYHSKF